MRRVLLASTVGRSSSWRRGCSASVPVMSAGWVGRGGGGATAAAAAVFRRDFSAAVQVEDVPPLSHVPRRIPTRHSRNLPPPVCPPEHVATLTDELLSSPPGSLYFLRSSATATTTNSSSSNSSRADPLDYFEVALEQADVTSQKFEYCLRGHAALLPGTRTHASSLVDQTTPPAASETGANPSMTPQERIAIMKKLVKRIEAEGDLYVEGWIKERSQLVVESLQNESTQHSKNVGMDDEDHTSNALHFGSSPGPTTAMYNVLLDALAVHGADEAPQEAYQILMTNILKRHEADGGPANTNPASVPTPASFNAVLRACANISYHSVTNTKEERVRDEAMEVTFGTFDAMRQSDAVQRNSATYTYMLETMAKCLPPSKSKGNICHGLWVHATKHERVVDQGLINAMVSTNIPSNGVDFDEWHAQHLLDPSSRTPKAFMTFPHVQRWYFKKRRDQPDDPTY